MTQRYRITHDPIRHSVLVACGRVRYVVTDGHEDRLNPDQPILGTRCNVLLKELTELGIDYVLISSSEENARDLSDAGFRPSTAPRRRPRRSSAPASTPHGRSSPTPGTRTSYPDRTAVPEPFWSERRHLQPI